MGRPTIRPGDIEATAAAQRGHTRPPTNPTATADGPTWRGDGGINCTSSDSLNLNDIHFLLTISLSLLSISFSRTQTLILYLSIYLSIYIYIHLYISYMKKVGILATGCRRYGVKNDARRQKRRKIAKINTKSKEKFALSARIIFWLPSFLIFFSGMVHIYLFIICMYSNSL